MAELSAQAEAILNAVTFARYDAPYFACPRSIDQIRIEAAGVLRAAADQVVPVTTKPNDTFCCPPVDSIVWIRVAKIRRELLAIAAELEAQP
jgi:hypothetical protein